MQVLIIDVSKCPECNSTKIQFNSKTHELYCQECGYVMQDRIPVIEAKYGKAEKVYINPKEKKIAIVIKGILKSPIEKKMTPFYAELKKFRLPKYVEAEVISICKKCVEEKLTMSYSKLKLLSATIYLVSKREGIPIMIKGLTKTYGVEKYDILKVAKFISKKFNLKLPNGDVENYIIRITSDLNKEGELTREAIKISKTLNICNPLIKTAVAIWLASQKLKIKLKKYELANACGISELTLRRNLRKSLN